MTGCGVLTLFGYPPHALRRTPPPDIDSRVVAIGVAAPQFTLPKSDGTSWALADALVRGPVVLLFYRGHW
jgi:hypothetical protein